MTGFYAWAALAAFGFVAAATLISRPEQMWANLYALDDLLGGRSSCLQQSRSSSQIVGSLIVLILLIFGIGAAAVAKQLGASP